tara:strand:+ start:827 stop:946 length:120 start_codon:yes stop_codon:yes gene_type:complete
MSSSAYMKMPKISFMIMARGSIQEEKRGISLDKVVSVFW